MNGANCKYINPLTGEDTCIFANTLDKLVPEICGFDDKCNRYGDMSNPCKRFHPARGQTKQEYSDLNGFVFPELIKRVFNDEIQEAPEIVQRMSFSSLDLNQAFIITVNKDDDEDEEDEDEEKIQTVPSSTPILTSLQTPSTSLETPVEDEDEMEEVCDEIEFQENMQEFFEEQQRLEVDPDFEDYIQFMENLVDIKNQALKYGMSVVF